MATDEVYGDEDINVEKATLENINVQLIRCIECAPKDIADRLKGKFLSPEDERYVAHDSHDKADKARRIIRAVSSRLERCKADKRQDLLQAFSDALWSMGEWTEDTVERLEEAYKTFSGGRALIRKSFAPTTETPVARPLTSTASASSRSSAQETRQSRSSSDELTLTVLMQNVPGLTNDKLNKLIDDKHLRSLAGYFDRIDGYVEKFQLPPGKQTDVRDLSFRRGTQTAMTEALKHWKSPNPFAATYGALLGIVLEMKRGDVAAGMAKYIAEMV